MLALKRFALVVLLLLVTSPAAFADIYVDFDGWRAYLPDNTWLTVDSTTSSYARVEVAKVFTQVPIDGVFAPNTIHFVQILDDAHTAPIIQITDELITNGTQTPWTDYHWTILGASAAFNQATIMSTGFTIDPFTTMTWGPAQTGWSDAYPALLNVAGGVVNAGDTYTPGLNGGRLDIQTDLSSSQPVEFYLQQIPTPEPATLALLGLGAFLLNQRRKNRRV